MENKTILTYSKKMFALGVLLIVAMCVVGFVASKKQVFIQVDGKLLTVETRAFNPLDVLENNGIVLADNDGYSIAQGQKFKAGATIEVIRAMPIKVWQNGKTKDYSVGRATVKEALAALEISTEGREVYPGLESRLEPNMEITILDENTKVENEKMTVAYSVVRNNDERLPYGEEKVITPGVAGEKIVTSRVAKVGTNVFKHEIGEKITKEPQAEVVAVGTGLGLLQTSRGVVRYREQRTMHATAYTLEDGNGDGVTSIGITPYHGIIAVDPDVIPYGTRVYIPGYGFAVAGDTGGAIVGNRIDLYMDDYSDAVNFGRRNVEMYILE